MMTKIKVADIYVSDDGCSPYTIEICGGADADKFQIIGKELYFFVPTCSTTTTTTTTSSTTATTTILPSTTSIPSSTTSSTTCPPSIYPDINEIISLNASYSQSSVYSSNIAADSNSMNNRISAEALATGTNAAGSQWIKMNLGNNYSVTKVIIGCDFNNTLSGGWSRWYTERLDVEFSLDNINWTKAFNTGSFCSSIQVYPVNFIARYIRIVNTNNSWIAATEFAAAGALI